mgnify:CR=1 FL=1
MRFKVSLFILFLFVSKLGLAQIQGVVVNKVTNQPIPYVNIWISGENIGTSSNHAGEFSLRPSDSSKLIQFSAIGFESLKIEISQLTSTTFLQPNSIQISEIHITASKKAKELVIGKVKKLESNYSYAANGIPWIVSRFIDYDTLYQKTPYISKARFRTKSKINNAKFIVHIQLPDENGQPGEHLVRENIYGFAKRGTRITEIDLSKYQLDFPKTGFFIGIERIIVEENKHEFKVIVSETNKKETITEYQPSLKASKDLTNRCAWIYSRGKWTRNTKALNIDTQTYKTYSTALAVQFVLSN